MAEQHHRPRRFQRGFTMLELLVAGAISGVVLTAVYFVFIATSAQYYVQEQLVQMQEGMRFAVEYIKNDLRNAGRLAVVNGIRIEGVGDAQGRDPQFCGVRDGIRGVELIEGQVAPAVLRANDNALQPDRLRLLVDASGAVPIQVGQIGGGGVDVSFARPESQRTIEAQRLLQIEGRFNASFQQGFYLYIVTRSGANDLVPIRQARFDADGAQLTLANPVCPSIATGCVAGGCLAAPVHLVEYAVMEQFLVTGEESSPDGRQRTDLVRRVLDAENPDRVLPNLSLTVAEFVIDLQIWGIYDTRQLGEPLARFPEDEDPTDDVGNLVSPQESQNLNTQPHRIRALNLMLATRTPREDPNFTLALDRGDDPAQRINVDRTWFELSPVDGSGLARVATLRATVDTPNLYRGVP